jgi:hypothetical protein
VRDGSRSPAGTSALAGKDLIHIHWGHKFGKDPGERRRRLDEHHHRRAGRRPQAKTRLTMNLAAARKFHRGVDRRAQRRPQCYAPSAEQTALATKLPVPGSLNQRGRCPVRGHAGRWGSRFVVHSSRFTTAGWLTAEGSRISSGPL